MVYDGHVHTPYCPHGSADSFSAYAEAAIQKGYSGLTFTEHAPLPKSFVDPTPFKDSGMQQGQLSGYFQELNALKRYYHSHLTIRTGLEVDYIEGYEEEIRTFLNEVGEELDDAILSVHFLKQKEKWYCLDYSPDVFGELVEATGSLEEVYRNYFQALLHSIKSDLGQFKPSRIGHITLVRKFHTKFPPDFSYEEEIVKVLDEIAKKGLELDYNGAGMMKEFCREPYPPAWIAREALKRNIPLVYGSDAHTAKGLKQGYKELIGKEAFKMPSTR
ncbi:histidinol-phosphatase HisJ [Pseudalkalibacillus caeni]|uniref:Histidinol-phosphatase n=1 Tax=Exobacillus caeni TaxID=2574798 RepID=A0A5R9FHP4_9BACL|nr:histidinol-phosphatase HisJ [Pseudalkalibacillus caeni]